MKKSCFLGILMLSSSLFFLIDGAMDEKGSMIPFFGALSIFGLVLFIKGFK